MDFLTQVTQQLSQADGRENMQAVLEQLSKNGLDDLARRENIDFPRAVSRMKKTDMIAILLDEIIRRNEVINNGEEITANGEITPLMEAAYNSQGNSEYVADVREKQRDNLKALADSIVVRVVDWNAVDEKNSANNSGATELQPEDTTAEKHGYDYNTQCEQCETQDVHNAENNGDIEPDAEALPDDFIPVEEAFSLPAVPAVEEYLPANTPKVMHWAFKWHYYHWDDFSQYSDKHLFDAGLFLGLKFSPSVSRDEAIKILTERMSLILQQTPDEETAACYCQDVQQPVAPVAQVQPKSSLAELLVQANQEVDAPLFTPEQLQAFTRQAFMETRRIAAKLTSHNTWRSRMVRARKLALDESRQIKIQF